MGACWSSVGAAGSSMAAAKFGLQERTVSFSSSVIAAFESCSALHAEASSRHTKQSESKEPSLHHLLQHSAPGKPPAAYQELDGLLNMAMEQLQASSAHLMWSDTDSCHTTPWLLLSASAATKQPAGLNQYLQAVLQQCRSNPSKIMLHVELDIPGVAPVIYSAAPLKPASSQVHGCLLIIHDSTSTLPACRLQSCEARMLANVGELAVRVLERYAHLAARLAAEHLPMPPHLLHMSLPPVKPMDGTSEGGDGPASSLKPGTPPPSQVQVVDMAAGNPWLSYNLPQNVLMMSGVRRQMLDKQDILHTCTLVVNTCAAGWPVLHCSDTWYLWAGLKRADTLGLPLQSLIRKAKLSAANLRWPELELSACRGHSFVLCDVALDAATLSELPAVSCTAYAPDTSPAAQHDMEQLLHQLVLHEKAMLAGVTDVACLSDVLGIHSIASSTTARRGDMGAETSSRPESACAGLLSYSDSWNRSATTRHDMATWADSELPEEGWHAGCLGPRFDLSFRPLATTTLNPLAPLPADVPKPCSGPLGGLYVVHVHTQGVLPLPDEMLQATAKVDDAQDLAVADLAECFWPGMQIGRKLGTGGYGSVYQGVWHQVRVAVKVQDIEINTPKRLAEAQLEVVLGQQLGHPALVPTLSHAVVEVRHPEPIQFLSMTASWHVLERRNTGSTAPQSPLAGAAVPPAGPTTPTATRAAAPITLRCLQLMEHCNAGTFQDGIDRGLLCLPTCADSVSSCLHQHPETGCVTLTKPQHMDAFRVLCVVHDVCAALHYLHTQGVVHADLSAGNVLLCVSGPREADMKLACQGVHVMHMVEQGGKEGGSHGQQLHSRPWLRAKVSDLGAARFVGPGGGSAPAKCYGTPTHMAPEVLADQQVSPASDIYSLGMLLWQICHQQPAWPGLSYHDVMRAVVTKRKLTWSVKPGLVSQLAELGKQCCDMDPAARPSALTVLQQVGEMLGQVAQSWAAAQDVPGVP